MAVLQAAEKACKIKGLHESAPLATVDRVC